MNIILNRTCYACPEQYDAVDENGTTLGYLRLRHGSFTVSCPDVGGTLVYSDSPKGDGIFFEEERDFYLNAAKLAITRYYNQSSGQNQYVIAFISFHDYVLKQEVIEADSEVEAAIAYLHKNSDCTSDCATMDEIKEACFDVDCMISVCQI